MSFTQQISYHSVRFWRCTAIRSLKFAIYCGFCITQGNKSRSVLNADWKHPPSGLLKHVSRLRSRTVSARYCRTRDPILTDQSFITSGDGGKLIRRLPSSKKRSNRTHVHCCSHRYSLMRLCGCRSIAVACRLLKWTFMATLLEQLLLASNFRHNFSFPEAASTRKLICLKSE